MFRLAAEDGVHVDACEARAWRLDWHRCLSFGQFGLQLMGYAVEKIRHVVDGTDSEIRHTAVCDASMGRDFEPIHTSVAQADAIDVGRLGDDDEVGLVSADPSLFGEVGNAGEPTALFVHAATLFDRALQTEAGPADRFDGEDGGCYAGFLIGDSAAVELAVADERAEGVDRPAVSYRDDIEVTVEVQRGSWLRAFHSAQNVHARVLRSMFRQSFSSYVVGVVAELFQLATDQFCAGGVVLARRIDGGNANEILEERDHLLADFFDASTDCLLSVH